MLTTSLKSVFLRLIQACPPFGTWWWQRWTIRESIGTASRNTSSMGLLATFAPVETVGLTLGLNQTYLPITGAAISTSLKRSKPVLTLVGKRKNEKVQRQARNPIWRTQIPWLPMLISIHLLSRFINWLFFFGTFSTMIETQIRPFWNDWKTLMKTCRDIRFRSSRRQTWLTLPAIWQKPLAIWRTKPITWRPSLTSASELGHKDLLSLQFNSLMVTSLYFDFAIIATSSVRAPIRAQWTFLRKKPRGSEACVWTIWKDVKLLFTAAVLHDFCLNQFPTFLLPLFQHHHFQCKFLAGACSTFGILHATKLLPLVGRGGWSPPCTCRISVWTVEQAVKFRVFNFQCLYGFRNLKELHQNFLNLRAMT